MKVFIYRSGSTRSHFLATATSGLMTGQLCVAVTDLFLLLGSTEIIFKLSHKFTGLNL